MLGHFNHLAPAHQTYTGKARHIPERELKENRKRVCNYEYLTQNEWTNTQVKDSKSRRIQLA